MNLNIIYDDESILIMDKPAGITVNRSDTTTNQYTVQDFIDEKHLVSKNADRDSDFYKRSGIVHRIDKETSGILVAAKTKDAFENILNYQTGGANGTLGLKIMVNIDK